MQPEYLDLKDGRNTKDPFDHWHHLYFFYPEDYQIVYAWTRPVNETATEIALVAINDGLVLGNWKNVNEDLIGPENDVQKIKFESNILFPIIAQLEYSLKTG